MHNLRRHFQSSVTSTAITRHCQLLMIKHRTITRHFQSSVVKLPPPSPSLQPPVTNLSPESTYHNVLHLLRSCKSLSRLHQIHGHLTVARSISNYGGWDQTTEKLILHLLNSYSSFHQIETVSNIFRHIHSPTAPLWNTIIRAHTNSGQHSKAIQLYHEMSTHGGVHPDKYTFTFVLKACAGAGDSKTGILVHEEVGKRGLEHDVYVRTGLIDMYCKLGMIELAYNLFDTMPLRDIVTWNAIISGLARSGGKGCEALHVFRRMQCAGIDPNSVTLLNLFPAMCQLEEVLLCKSVHGYLVRKCLLFGIFNRLIDAYSKCRDVNLAWRVFDGMRGARDDASWATMISGYVYNGCFAEALELFDDLRMAGIGVTAVSVVSAAVAAMETGDLEKGMDVHAYATLKKADKDIQVCTALLTMYSKCGKIEKASQLFSEIQEKDAVAWSAMISAFSQSGYAKESLSVFLEMIETGIRPNTVSIISVLPACADLLDLKLGKSIHCYIIKMSSNELDPSTGTALVAMYSKCGDFTYANALFNILQPEDIVTWNALISAYSQKGDIKDALEMFSQLLFCGICPDAGTLVGVLPACALSKDIVQGMSVHGFIVKNGYEHDIQVRNAIIDMYVKCGRLETAEILFNESGCLKDIISWNTMIAGFMHNGHAKKALSAFHQLRTEGFKPNLVTLLSMFPAASHLAALKEGMSFHSLATRIGASNHVVIENSLIDMYSKCGRLDLAQEIFNQMDYKDSVSWNSMMMAFSIHGMGKEALALFSQMRGRSVPMDTVSYVGVLSACRHGGLIEEGRKIFQSMKSEYSFEPKLEHYACMVDLYGRASRMDEALDLIQNMPMKPDASVWGAFLDACRVHSNVGLGNMAVEHLRKLESHNSAPYVLLSEIYAQHGRWVEARKVRKTMRHAGVSKTPGYSWVHFRNTICLES